MMRSPSDSSRSCCLNFGLVELRRAIRWNRAARDGGSQSRGELLTASPEEKGERGNRPRRRRGCRRAARTSNPRGFGRGVRGGERWDGRVTIAGRDARLDEESLEG